MKRFILYLILAYVALTMQGIFFGSMKPNFVLILVSFYALQASQREGVMYGVLTGAIVDTISGFMMGPHIIGKSVAAFLTRRIRERVFQWNFLMWVFIIALLSIADILLVYLSLEAFSSMSFVNRPWKLSFSEGLYTIAAGVILYPFFRPWKSGDFL